MPSPFARVAVPATGALLLAAALPGLPGTAGPRAAAQTPAAQTGTVRGRVIEAGSERPVADVQVLVVGTSTGTVTNALGEYVLPRVPAGARTVRVRRIGFGAVERPVMVTAGAEARLDVTLAQAASQLDQVVVTALGQTTTQRALGTSQQTVAGPDIAQTQRENFVNALQGRIAGVNVTSSSGVPGASSTITIRGVSSISSSNQPLFIVDGLPVDNKTLNTAVFASEANATTALSNRGVDFTNRAADINPEDIESLVVLKGPEAAALYGIDAANGAIVITTKRGRAGQGGFQYSNNFRVEGVRGQPEVQRVYSPLAALGATPTSTGTTYLYFGAPYPAGTTFYDNVGSFFRTGTSQQHNLSFSGAAPDGRVSYRLSGGGVRQKGVVPGSDYNRLNLTGASTGQVGRWLTTDLSMTYGYATNDQSYKGEGGPLIGLLVWPQTDDAKNYLTPAGTRRRLSPTLTATEVDNPYYNVAKNTIGSKTNRFVANLGLTLAPFAWGNLKTNVGADSYTNQNQLVRDPDSNYGNSFNGILDGADDVTRNLNAQTILNVNPVAVTKRLSVSGLVGNQVNDFRSNVDAFVGRDFFDPGFVSINNTNVRSGKTTIAQRRLVGLYGQAVFDYNRYLYVTVQGRNDWTSTIPQGRNSFFYPSVTSSFVFSDAFPGVRRFMTGKLRAAYAEVGRDARPYAYRPSLESKLTSYGGYGYGFTGPNLDLKPEFAKSYEVGTELTFLQDRLGFDVTTYRKTTTDQIVNDIRGSYATGFILFNLNGASTRNTGVEATLRAAPVRGPRFAWDVQANFDHHQGRVLKLPNALPESYVSDTWLYGNVRNGTAPGLSTESLTGFFYLRSNQGKLLIDPTTGLPIRSGTFVDGGYDRTPDFNVGVTNNLRYRKLSLSFLLDIRKGGDVFNATQHYLTSRGLATSTLDRETPRVIEGVLRDGRQNSATPTPNTIVIVPAVQTAYYTGISEELFIEKNINWLRLRDVRLSVGLPARFGRNASVFVQGTDLLLVTNYSGLDPVVNGNTAAVGGSGAAGIDYGNFPLPRGLNFGISTGF